MNTVKPESYCVVLPDARRRGAGKDSPAMLPLTCFTGNCAGRGFIPFDGGFANTARQAFTTYTALIFIGATGIAVRVLSAVGERQVQRSGGGRAVMNVVGMSLAAAFRFVRAGPMP